MKNIVVLDGYSLNPGDLSWKALEALGHCTIYDRTPSESVISRSKEADIILVNKVRLTKEIQESLPKLKYIGVLATGYDNVYSENPNVIVTNVPAYSTASVAQHTFAMILAFTHHIAEHSKGVHEGRWTKSPDFCYWDFPLIELEGLSLGIIGYGAIGKKVAEIAASFGMQILVMTRSPEKIDKNLKNISVVTKDELLRKSDFITIHCPKTVETTNFITKKELNLMKPTAFLINVSRGGIVNEEDLAHILNEGKIAGAAFDVLTSEPPPATHPLLTAKNCLLTPHIAWATCAARQRLLNVAVENIQAFLSGKPQNVVNLRVKS